MGPLGRAVLAAAGAGVVTAACGSGENGPTPTPTPRPATPAFVFVLTPDPVESLQNTPVLSVLRVAPTGDLTLADRRGLLGARVTAADALGRLLFVGGRKIYRDERGTRRVDEVLRSYAVDPDSGVVRQRGERLMPTYDDTFGWHGWPRFLGVERLAATADRVYAALNDRDRNVQSFRQYRFDATTGAIEEAPRLRCDVDGMPVWLLARPPYLLMDDSFDCYPYEGPYAAYKTGTAFGVFAAQAADGGRLHRIGSAKPARGGVDSYRAALTGDCVLVGLSDHWRPGGGERDGVTAFAIDPATGTPSERNTIGASVPTALAAVPGLVAIASTREAASSLEVHALSANCEIDERGPSLGSVAVSSLAFHPSGQYLWAVQDGGIQTYAGLPDGSWEKRGFASGVTGDLVVAPIPSDR